ncbi:uncharacterized protein [Anabrus simplex]|uniref:uncharacterized protein n=1 Tax=Anabrus simplex TaxID=316456 RepID=UPI0035A26AEF
MCKYGLLLLAWIAIGAQGQEDMPNLEQAAAAEQRLSDQIRVILEHYKKPDPVGIPGANIPDPFPVPDMTKTILTATGTMKDMRVYGLSRFRVRYMETELTKMEVSAGVQIDKMFIEGSYTIRFFLSRSQGKFNVSLDNVQTEGMVKLMVGRDGKLQADNIDMDFTYSNMKVNLENSARSSVTNSFISGMIPFVIDGLKPYILREVNRDVRADINKQIAELPHMFPNSISPLDFMISDARRLVQFMGYDPYKLPDYTYTAGMTYMHLSHIWVMGLASFHRVGNITVGFEKHVMKTGIHVGTLKLGGRCHWEASTLGGYLTRAGAAQFTVDYMQVHAMLSQPLDTRQHPKLENFDVKLGDFEIRVAGTGTFDYVIELIANLLPNLLRYHITSAIETKVRASIQEALDRVDMEELIEERLQQLERMTEE